MLHDLLYQLVFYFVAKSSCYIFYLLYAYYTGILRTIVQVPNDMAGPGGSFTSTGACNQEVLGTRAGYLSSWFAHTVLQTVQRNEVYSVVCCTVHNEEPFKSFEISVGHKLRASVCHDIASMCRKRRKAIYTYIYQMI